MIPYHDHSRFFSDNIFFLEGDCSPLSFQVLILCWTVTAISFVVFFAGCQPIIWPFWKGVTSLPQVWHGCLRNNKLHTGSVRVKKKTCHQLKHIKLLPICLVKSRWLPFFGHAVCHVANWAYIILHILWLTTVIIAWHFFLMNSEICLYFCHILRETHSISTPSLHSHHCCTEWRSEY